MAAFLTEVKARLTAAGVDHEAVRLVALAKQYPKFAADMLEHDQLAPDASSWVVFEDDCRKQKERDEWLRQEKMREQRTRKKQLECAIATINSTPMKTSLSEELRGTVLRALARGHAPLANYLNALNVSDCLPLASDVQAVLEGPSQMLSVVRGKQQQPSDACKQPNRA